MSNIKYTTDGKKVVVICNLNSQEKIVQEVFIVDNGEIPSGEHFVVKSLHDSPAVSWKESELKRMEERYDSERKKWEADLDRLTKLYRLKTEELKGKLNYVGAALKNASEDSFKTLVDFLTGEIKWIVKTGYDPALIEFKDFSLVYERDTLRLISILGGDDGSMTYCVHRYSNSSGGSDNFMPFSDYDSAITFFKKNILENKSYNRYIIAAAEKHNIELDSEKVNEFYNSQISQSEKTLKTYEENISVCNKAIEDAKSKLINLNK